MATKKADQRKPGLGIVAAATNPKPQGAALGPTNIYLSVSPINQVFEIPVSTPNTPQTPIIPRPNPADITDTTLGETQLVSFCCGKYHPLTLLNCLRYVILALLAAVAVLITILATRSSDQPIGSQQAGASAPTNQTTAGGKLNGTFTGGFCSSPGNFPAMMARVYSSSYILTSAEGQKLGKSPLDFLSKELSKFSSATKIFATRDLLPKVSVARDFHKACDNVPNVLVIIKSGQYIAGGFTEIAFESTPGNVYKTDPDLTTFLFSANRKRRYRLRDENMAINCNQDFGPRFGNSGIGVHSVYTGNDNWENTVDIRSSFYPSVAVTGELFGTLNCYFDEYEVYKLE